MKNWIRLLIMLIEYNVESYINKSQVTGINEQEEGATGRAGEAAVGDF